MTVTVADSDKEKIREVVQRMVAGEKSLHVKVIGNLKLVRTSEIPWAIIDRHKQEVSLGYWKFLKSYKGIDFYERQERQRR